MKNNKTRKKVVVAISGGVDSAVAAAMLKKRGYDVSGVFMDFGFQTGKNKLEAKQIAERLEIPFYILNVKKDFRKKVVDYFLDELKKGNTPNPCIVCNKEIKFKVLLEKMISIKADYAATGHYARIVYDMENYHLLEAKDKSKDQSYFLYKLNQKQLAKILFPLGDFAKAKVRKMAKNFDLPVYDKKESQDVCFIPEKGYENFLKKMLKPASSVDGPKKGKICNLEGNILGDHKGLPFYTLGQRKGIELGGQGPYFVIKKDFRKNRLIVTNKKEDLELFSKKTSIKCANWIQKNLKFPLKTQARTRYRNMMVGAIIKSNSNKFEVEFEKNQRAVTSGQSVVFYSKKGEVIGGGVII